MWIDYIRLSREFPPAIDLKRIESFSGAEPNALRYTHKMAGRPVGAHLARLCGAQT